MARPNPIHRKIFNLHRDDGAYHPDPQALEEVWKYGQEIPTVAEAMPSRLEPSKKVARPYNKYVAKWNNPVCLYYVLDLMVTARRGAYIRSTYLAHELEKTAPMYHWRPASIGRMLGGIYDTVAEHYGRVEGNEMFPIGRGRDARGQYYVVDPHGGIEGALWLVKARDAIYRKAEQIMVQEMNGDLDHSIWSSGQAGFAGPAEYYFEALPGAVRDMDFYLTQLDDQHLYGARLHANRERNIRSAF